MIIEENSEFILERNKLIRELDQNKNLSEEQKLILTEKIHRLEETIESNVKNKLKTMEAKIMANPEQAHEEKPAKEKKEKKTIKQKVEEIEEDSYNYLKEKSQNDIKVLVSLICKLLGKARKEKQGDDKNDEN